MSSYTLLKYSVHFNTLNSEFVYFVCYTALLIHIVNFITLLYYIAKGSIGLDSRLQWWRLHLFQLARNFTSPHPSAND